MNDDISSNVPQDLDDERFRLAKTAGIAEVRFPETPQEADRVEELLEKELAKLSLVEHEKILFDVHGFSHTEDEDPAFIAAKLQELEENLKTCKHPRAAFDRAKQLNSDFVTDCQFRIMFLRSERFDAKLAAQRMLRHFECKKNIFGDGEILGREVRLSDLSKDSMEALETGFIQILPTRDAAGRSIFCCCPMYRPRDKPLEALGGAMWYMFNTCLKDEETQKKGIVVVVHNTGPCPVKENLDFLRRVHKIREGIPKRVVGAHYCFQDASLRPFVAGLHLFLDKDTRSRFRPHCGDPDSIRFELQTFGIPTQDQPINENGRLSLGWHREWLEVRKTQESSDGTTDTGIIIPQRFDVLFGKSKKEREHTGNLRAAHLVEMYRDDYERAGKFEKTEIAERIVSIIRESYGRFLRWDKDGWVEVDDEVARDKISHFFRHMRSKKANKENESLSSSEEKPTRNLKRTKHPTPPKVRSSSPVKV